LLVAQGMGGYVCPLKDLKQVSAIDMVLAMKRFKDSYRTFPHMTSPYVFPAKGLGTTLAQACAKVVAKAGGVSLSRLPIDNVVYDEAGRACGVSSQGAIVHASEVVAAPAYVPDLVEPQYQIIRLFAVLNHAPNKCKDSRSCQLIIPAMHCGRKNSIYIFSSGHSHSVAPSGKWIVTVSTRIEGPVEGLSDLAVAKRELAAALPLLRPARKLLAQISSLHVARAGATVDGLHVIPSNDETLAFSEVATEAEAIFESIVGEPVGTPS